jgi:hypothetical protein
MVYSCLESNDFLGHALKTARKAKHSNSDSDSMSDAPPRAPRNIEEDDDMGLHEALAKAVRTISRCTSTSSFSSGYDLQVPDSEEDDEEEVKEEAVKQKKVRCIYTTICELSSRFSKASQGFSHSPKSS